MALSKQDISNTARHLKYDIIGLNMNQQGGASMAYGGAGYRYFGFYGTLLFRLQQMAPNEEAMLTGRAYGSIAFNGFTYPAVGDSIQVAIVGGLITNPIVATVIVPQVAAGQSPWSLMNLAGALAQAFAIQPAFQAAGFAAIADYGSSPFSDTKILVPICSLIAPANTSFQISATFTGSTPPQIIANGTLLPPYLALSGPYGTAKVFGFLPILDYLESAMGGATQNLSLSRAEDAYFRNDEVDAREDLYEKYIDKLANFLGVPRNPQRKGGASGSVVC